MTASVHEPIRVEPLTGAALAAALPRVAELRIDVFRAFPYLYDGDLAYEENYLAAYAGSPGAIVVGAWDSARLVGAATGAPMEDHAAEFAAPFAERGYDLSEIFYCGESVLRGALQVGRWRPLAAPIPSDRIVL